MPESFANNHQFLYTFIVLVKAVGWFGIIAALIFFCFGPSITWRKGPSINADALEAFNDTLEWAQQEIAKAQRTEAQRLEEKQKSDEYYASLGKKKYLIPVEWAQTHTFEIWADNLREAIDQADAADLPRGEYVNDSYENREDLLDEVNPAHAAEIQRWREEGGGGEEA